LVGNHSYYAVMIGFLGFQLASVSSWFNTQIHRMVLVYTPILVNKQL
jgi:hypothetical protein